MMKDIEMSYKNFYIAVTNSLGNFRKKLVPPIAAGKYSKKTKEHILEIIDGDKDSKYNVTRQYNVLAAANKDPFRMDKLHKFSHHLNSSQILCYNYFRPYFTGDVIAIPDALGKKILSLIGTTIVKSVFEYEQKEHEWIWKPKDAKRKETEGTNFDFYVESEQSQVFFEIKYTEQGFGNITDSDRDKKLGKYEDKYKNLYRRHLDECIAIREDKRDEINMETFFKYYQLFRNIIRIKAANQYAVFIFPEENTKCESEFSEFFKICNPENIIKIHWRELLDETTKATGFDDKYFSFTIK